jgi:hypothetical protein
MKKSKIKLPPDFDPAKFPHYSVQSSIYSLILSALHLSTHYEKWPGAEKRQAKLEKLLTRYLKTINDVQKVNKSHAKRH